MKDLFLIFILAAAFAFGYYVIARADLFIEENQRLIADENRNGKSKIRIAAESPMLLHAVAPALESCSNADPHIGFFLSSGKTSRLFEKLREEQVDIVLLDGEQPAQFEQQYASLRIPCGQTAEPVSVCGLPVENLDAEGRVYVVWKREVSSRDRDRVIFALENEHCRLKCGYADYLDDLA